LEVERDALAAAIGRWAPGGIHHVGSTAVPGPDAKPVIDILVGVRDLATSRACFEPIAQLGYVYAPYLIEEMQWFCKPDPSRRTHHLHLVPADSQWFREELAFRDYLRAHPRWRYDREAYADAKAGFICDVLARTEAQATPGGHRSSLHN
jgi:GrpB-like predicted nucleotidyltransferase (UPF0157 family)